MQLIESVFASPCTLAMRPAPTAIPPPSRPGAPPLDVAVALGQERSEQSPPRQPGWQWHVAL